jgi:hypothetical protein
MSNYGAIPGHSSRVVFQFRIHAILKYIFRMYSVRFCMPHLHGNKQLPNKTDSVGIWTMGPHDTRRRMKWAARRNVRTCVTTLWRLLFGMRHHVIIYWHFGAMLCLQLQDRFQWRLRRCVTPKCRKFLANDWPHIQEKWTWCMNDGLYSTVVYFISSLFCSRSRWPCRLERGSTAARLLGSRVRIPPWAWQSVSCECCVLSCRGFCVELIPRSEEFYRLCVSVFVFLSVIRGYSNSLHIKTGRRRKIKKERIVMHS